MAGKTFELVKKMLQAMCTPNTRIEMVCASHYEAQHFVYRWGKMFIEHGAVYRASDRMFAFSGQSSIRIGIANNEHDVDRFRGLNADNWVLSRFLDAQLKQRMQTLIFRSEMSTIDPWESGPPQTETPKP